MGKLITETKEYVRGSNALLDNIFEENDGKLYVVQGHIGRKPILANSIEEANERYLAKNTPTVEVEDDID